MIPLLPLYLEKTCHRASVYSAPRRGTVLNEEEQVLPMTKGGDPVLTGFSTGVLLYIIKEEDKNVPRGGAVD